MMWLRKNVKRLICGLISVLSVLMVFNSMILYSYAEKAELATLEQDSDITIIVGYDTEIPKIVFISPDDEKYESDEQFDSVQKADKQIYYNIADARRGTWLVEYDKGKNKEITVDVLPWHRGITAKAFSFETEAADDKPLPYVKGKITADYGENRYNFIISAAVVDADGNIQNRIECYEGSAYGSDEYEFSFYPDLLPDGEYVLMAEVYAYDNTETEVRDTITATGKKLVIQGNTDAGESSCISIFCNITDSMADISFDASAQEIYCDEYVLMIYQGDSSNFLSKQQFYESQFTDHVIFEPDGGDITVQVNAKERYGSYISWSKTFKPEMPISLSIETPEITNELNAVVDFDAGENTYQGNIILGENTKRVQFNGKNKFQVSLETMDVNELEIQVTDDNVVYSINQRIAVDTIPPVIDIYGASDNMVCNDDKALFIGKTDAGTVLMCNNEKVELDADGNFSITMALADEVNDFRFEASDEAGNVTVRELHITRATVNKKIQHGKKGWLTLIISIGISALFALIIGGVTIIVRNKNAKKGKTTNTIVTALITLAVTLSASFAGFGGLQLYWHTKKDNELSGVSLIEMLHSLSTSEIVSKMDVSRQYVYSSIISFGIAALIAVILVVSLVVSKAIKKRRKKNGGAPKKDNKS